MSISQGNEREEMTPLRENAAALFVFVVFAAHDQVKKVKIRVEKVMSEISALPRQASKFVANILGTDDK